MPDQPRQPPAQPQDPHEPPNPATPARDVSALPTEAELARVAIPATVRRAPRYRSFVLAGVVVGLLATLVVAIAGRGSAGAVIADVMIGLGLVTVCGVAGAVAAVLAEAASRRR